MCSGLRVIFQFCLTLQIGGMKEGDYIVGIGERDVKWSSHEDVVTYIKSASNTLKLRLVTPMDRSTKSMYKDKVGGWKQLHCYLVNPKKAIRFLLHRADSGLLRGFGGFQSHLKKILEAVNLNVALFLHVHPDKGLKSSYSFYCQ